MNDPKARQWLTKPDGLATALRRIREGANRSGLSMANELKWASSKITRIEQGIQAPKEADIRAWVKECGGDDKDIARLLELFSEFQRVRGILRQRTQRAEDQPRNDVSALVDTTTLFRAYSTWAVPPVAQNHDYAIAVLAERETLHPGAAPDLAIAAQGRARRDALLYDTTREFKILLDESVLYRQHGSPQVLRAQLDRLLSIERLDPVELAVIPFASPVVIPAVHSFAIYDDQTFIDLFTGDEPAVSYDPDFYPRVFGQLWESAVTGNPARELISKAAGQLG